MSGPGKCTKYLIPKSFFCCWSLKTGAITTGIIYSCLIVLEVILTSVQVSNTLLNENSLSSRTNYAYAIVSVIYAIFMLILCLWFIWGAVKGKASVVISWLLLAMVWLLELFCKSVVLLYFHVNETGLFVGTVNVIVSITVIGFLIYTLLVVLAYWLQLKKEGREQRNEAS